MVVSFVGVGVNEIGHEQADYDLYDKVVEQVNAQVRDDAQGQPCAIERAAQQSALHRAILGA